MAGGRVMCLKKKYIVNNRYTAPIKPSEARDGLRREWHKVLEEVKDHSLDKSDLIHIWDWVCQEHYRRYYPLEEELYGAKSASDCERFGMLGGCAPACPVYRNGECEEGKENTEKFIEDGEFDQEEIKKYKDMYNV